MAYGTKILVKKKVFKKAPPLKSAFGGCLSFLSVPLFRASHTVSFFVQDDMEMSYRQRRWKEIQPDGGAIWWNVVIPMKVRHSCGDRGLISVLDRNWGPCTFDFDRKYDRHLYVPARTEFTIDPLSVFFLYLGWGNSGTHYPFTCTGRGWWGAPPSPLPPGYGPDDLCMTFDLGTVLTKKSLSIIISF